MEMEYRFDGNDFQINDFSNEDFIQSIYAFQLPKDTKITSYFPISRVNLNTGVMWLPIPLKKAKITLDSEKSILFLFSFNVLVNNNKFVTRLKINELIQVVF